MTRRLPALGASLAVLLLVLASVARSDSQAAAPAGSPHLAEPLAQLAWLLGDWNCVGTSTGGKGSRVVHNHVKLGSHGDAFEFASTMEGSDRVAYDVLGFNTVTQQWYEHAVVEGTDREDEIGAPDALAGNSLTLLGNLEYNRKVIKIRSTYSWANPDAYRFEGAFQKADGSWETIEVHECKRKSST